MIAVEEPSLSEAWVATLTAVLRSGGAAVNVVTSWRADQERVEVRDVLDRFVSSRPYGSTSWPRWPVETVANTIFATELYEESLGSDALADFSDLYLEGYEVSQAASPGGEYCHRLVAWDGPDGEPINQLLDVGEKLRRYANPDDRSYRYSSDYELALEDPILDLRTQMPGRNGDPYGFPCLSHISLTVDHGVVHLTALYRNQHLIKKAYGNYLGLSRLGRALCHHSGLELGTVTVVATHADAEVNSAKGFGKAALDQLLSDVRDALDIQQQDADATVSADCLEAATRRAMSETCGDHSHVIGVDAVDVAEFSSDFRGEADVLETVFAPDEIAECAGDNERLAARFAAKEATLKALGTGIRGLDMLDIVVETAPNGKPSLVLSDAAREHAAGHGIGELACSLTHEEGFAIAAVVANQERPMSTESQSTASLKEAL